MRIEQFVVQNFRKLKCCHIELEKKETLFVGANNSGKTSAMDALMLFLKKKGKRNIVVTDFTLSNWAAINEIGDDWVISSQNSESSPPDLSRDRWEPYLPTLDVWIDVEEREIHHVSHIIPTLDWDGGLLGIRMVFEPEDREELYRQFISAHSTSQKTLATRKSMSNGLATLSLWPRNMQDFLERELHRRFIVQSYILDPKYAQEETPQELPKGSLPLERDPFVGLFKVDIINAQRGFSDPSNEESNATNDRRLSVQLRKYFNAHLNPTDLPDENDLDALESIETARLSFDEKLKLSFESALGELEQINYPGFGNPRIELSSRIQPLDGLNHDSAVRFAVNRPESGGTSLTLPERYNGLGYQNLISMVFTLIRFRDEWMRVKKSGLNGEDQLIEPLHLVLIEEPEAHLHAQVQQVFIKKAYEVLRNHSLLKNDNIFLTQLVLSTHSSHIAHNIDFSSLRYFRRRPAASGQDVPCATVANLSTVFGGDNKTSKFATRYLKTTHCDLFFADAAILVEGPSERILLPHFIRSQFPDLDVSYITILEIGGSHAHRLRPLLEVMDLLTLVVTDLDPIEGNRKKKVLPEKYRNYRTQNSTIKLWVPKKTRLDEILDTTEADKVTSGGKVRVAYQDTIRLQFGFQDNVEAIPHTFEDALVLGNIDYFRNIDRCNGLLKRMCEATKKDSVYDACIYMFKHLQKGDKAEMALNLLFLENPQSLLIPQYIKEGLEWLQDKLRIQIREFPETVISGTSQS